MEKIMRNLYNIVFGNENQVDKRRTECYLPQSTQFNETSSTDPGFNCWGISKTDCRIFRGGILHVDASRNQHSNVFE